MIVYLQHNDEKPIKVVVKDQAKLNEYIKKGNLTIKGKSYRILSEDFTDAIEVFYSTSNKEVWENYNKLKAKIKHFKRTKQWLQDP